jgi:hypothetical protein
MKMGAAIVLLLGIIMFFFSCQKEKERCFATISIRLDDRAEEMEWMEVEAQRSDRNGTIVIEATGYNDERFLIKLQNVYDTGTIAHLTVAQLFIADGLGFSAEEIQTGFINIKERSPSRLSGSFDVVFNCSSGAGNTMSAEGLFTIYGKN